MMEYQTISLESEAGFRALFQYATVGILVIGSDGRIRLANPCIERLFDYSSAELIGQPVEILLPHAFREDHVSRRDSYFARPRARPMGFGLSLHALKKDGTEFPVEISLGHYRFNDEALAVAFVTDITERNKAVEALHEGKRKLDEETEDLKFLSDAGNRLWQMESLEEGLKEILMSAIELTKADMGNVQLYDPVKKVLRIVAQKGFDSGFLHHFREVTADDLSACGRALRDGKQVTIHDTQKEWTGADREIALRSGFRSVQSTPLIARDDTPLGMISTHFKTPRIFDELALSRIQLYAHKARSFIEKVRSHEVIKNYNLELEDKIKERTVELISSLEREKELSQLKSRFVSMASHEFRTPLSTIQSSLSLVEAYGKDEDRDKRKKHTDRIKSSVKNLVDILNDFLSLEKLEQGKVEVIREKFNLYDFTAEIKEEVAGILRTGQRIEFTYAGEHEVHMDKKILKNILLNLISNASKYSGDGKEIDLQIENGSALSVNVRDHGIGIPEDEQKNMFERFFRAKNTTQIQGTGLGLNIVKRYIELLGGTISFVSKRDEGTTFTISLPA